MLLNFVLMNAVIGQAGDTAPPTAAAAVVAAHADAAPFPAEVRFFLRYLFLPETDEDGP